jgi:hypothetical protein
MNIKQVKLEIHTETHAGLHVHCESLTKTGMCLQLSVRIPQYTNLIEILTAVTSMFHADRHGEDNNRI